MRVDTVHFTASPLHVWDIATIHPLGGLNPPGHVFPTDHIYFYMHQDASGAPLEVPLFSPGNLTVVNVSASQHVNAGFTDFTLEMQPCADVAVVFGHITSLDSEVFGDTTSFTDWTLSNEYSTGGETYRLWRRDVSIEVTAGQRLGTTGGRWGQFALDFGVYDRRRTAEDVATPARWTHSRVLTAVCPLDYYAEGPLQATLLDSVESDPMLPADERCAKVFQDVPGTARGCWFAKDVLNTYPEDPHLALVTSNLRPWESVLSVGTSVPGLPSGLYTFVPQAGGLVNRTFEEVSADGAIYGFQVNGFEGVILLKMSDDVTLWIEAVPGGSVVPERWTFTSIKAVFER